VLKRGGRGLLVLPVQVGGETDHVPPAAQELCGARHVTAGVMVLVPGRELMPVMVKQTVT
jgi:hypothetical protein